MTLGPKSAASAAVWSGVDEGFRIQELPLPRLRDGEVLVRLELATICGSDLHTTAGHRPTPVPTVLGHEAVGFVEAIGGEVRTPDGRLLQIGERITWTIGTSCGTCRRCVRGVPQKCVEVRKYGHEAISDDWQLNGDFATHAHLIAGTGVVRVPGSLPASVVAPANCATATVVCAARRANLGAGDAVVVIGCGMLGLTAVAYARDLGAESVIACDVDASRRELALAFGATAVCAPEDLPAVAAEHGADVVLEISGNSRAVQSALAVVGMNGRVVLVGSVSPAPEISFEPSSFVRNLSSVIGSHNYPVEDLVEAVAFLERTSLQDEFDSLIGGTFPLAEIDGAFTAARESGAPRIAIRTS